MTLSSPYVTPCPSRVTKSWFLRTMSRQLVNICKDGDTIISLGNLFWCSIILTIKIVSWCSDPVSIASHPDIGHHWKEFGSVFFVSALSKYLYTLMKHLLRAFCRVNSPRTLVLSSYKRCYCTIVTFVILHLTVSVNPCLPCSGKPRTSTAVVASSLLGRGEGSSPSIFFQQGHIAGS